MPPDVRPEDMSGSRNQAGHREDSAGAPGPGTPAQAESGFTDGSGAIFSFYLEKAEEEDNKMAEGWKGDADGILVFTGLFSATVATFLGISLQNLTQNSQDTSAFYLARLYQLSAANGPNDTVPIPLPSLSDPSSFSPTASAIWVNVLWLLSLVISLTCALLATLLQQWARRYLRLTRPARALHKRARIRSFMRQGVDKFYLPSVVEALPGLLHVSVFLFFAGLAIFLSGVNSIVFKAILSSTSASGGMYICATLMPLFRHDSPYHTSLSALFWVLDVGVRQTAISILNSIYKREPQVERPWSWGAKFDRWRDRVTRRSRGMASEVERIATGWSLWQVDARAIQSFIQTLDEDHEIERLVAGIPGFCNSRAINILGPVSDILMGELISTQDLGNTIVEFVKRSVSSDSIAEETQLRRVKISAKAFITLPSMFRASSWNMTLSLFSLHRLRSDPPSWWLELGNLFTHFADDLDPDVAAQARICTAFFLQYANRSDPRWFPLMIKHLGVTEPILQRYLSHGDSLSLAYTILIMRSRPHFSYVLWYNLFRVGDEEHFDIRNTLSELQHGFCKAWNELVENHDVSIYARSYFKTLFLALHPASTPTPNPVGESWPWSPLCTDPTHLQPPPDASHESHAPLPAPTPPKQLPGPTLPSAPASEHSEVTSVSSVSFPQPADLMTSISRLDAAVAASSTNLAQGHLAITIVDPPLPPHAPDDSDTPLSHNTTALHESAIPPLLAHPLQAHVVLPDSTMGPSLPQDPNTSASLQSAG